MRGTEHIQHQDVIKTHGFVERKKITKFLIRSKLKDEEETGFPIMFDWLSFLVPTNYSFGFWKKCPFNLGTFESSLVQNKVSKWARNDFLACKQILIRRVLRCVERVFMISNRWKKVFDNFCDYPSPPKNVTCYQYCSYIFNNLRLSLYPYKFRQKSLLLINRFGHFSRQNEAFCCKMVIG